MSPKQDLYLDLLRIVLPFLRNRETWSIWNRIRFGSAYPEAELIHNLPRCLRDSDFGREDLWRLNVQARNYLKPGARNTLEGPVQAIVKEIFQLVPPDQQGLLVWPGPK